MRKRSFLFWSALIAGFFIMIAGATGNALAVSGKITIAFAAESNVLDVTKAAAGVDWYFNQQIYEMLVTADNKLNRVNWLAKSWKLNYVRGKPVITVNLRKGVKLSNKLYETEASGGVTLKNIKKIAYSGVKRISVGQITHSAPAVNFKLEI